MGDGGRQLGDDGGDMGEDGGELRFSTTAGDGGL